MLHVQKQKGARPHSGVSLLAELSGEATATNSEELIALCSGRFETQPETQRSGGGGLSKLLRSASFISQADKSTLDSTDMSEVIGLCSGAFPSTQHHPRETTSEPFSKFGANVCGREVATSSGGEGEEEEGGEVLSWTQRQRKLTSMLALAGGEEDDAMPRLSRKRKRGRPRPKATRG